MSDDDVEPSDDVYHYWYAAVAWDGSGNYNIAEKEWVPGEEDGGDDTGDEFLGGFGLILTIIVILVVVLILLVVILVIVMMVVRKKKEEEEEVIPEPQEEEQQLEDHTAVAPTPATPAPAEGSTYTTYQDDYVEEGLPDPTQEVLVPEIVTDELTPELRDVHEMETGPAVRKSTMGLAGPRGKRPVKKLKKKESSTLGLQMEEQFLLEEGDPYRMDDLKAWGDPTKDDQGPDLEENPDQKEY